MARGMFRGAAAAWLGLIALQTFTTDRGAGAVGGILETVNGLVQRVLDPSVPAIPDHSSKAPAPGDTPSPYLNGITPNDLRRGAGNAALLENGGAQKLADALNNAIPQGDLQKQLGGLGALSNYTPEQLMKLWGIPNN